MLEDPYPHRRVAEVRIRRPGHVCKHALANIRCYALATELRTSRTTLPKAKLERVRRRSTSVGTAIEILAIRAVEYQFHVRSSRTSNTLDGAAISLIYQIALSLWLPRIRWEVGRTPVETI
jgi:hypothetical protein